MMERISRRSAVAGIAATVAVLQSSGLTASAQGGANPQNGPALPSVDKDLTSWGWDGTRESLSNQLAEFFAGETAPFVAVRDQDKGRLQPNGQYLLADQMRAPLFGVADSKLIEPDGSTIYPAYFFHNTFLRIFVKADVGGHVEAVALADTLDITKNGTVVDFVPKLTIYYRGPYPTDLRDEAVNAMNQIWSREPPAPMMHDRSVKVFDHKLE
jgi:hypothetical protein